MSFEPVDQTFGALDGDYAESSSATTCAQYDDPGHRRKFAATIPPQLQLDTLDKTFESLNNVSLKKRTLEGEVISSTDNLFKPSLDRTTSTGSGLGSQDGEGESPGLDALAIVAREMR